jgi:hypothetical protein
VAVLPKPLGLTVLAVLVAAVQGEQEVEETEPLQRAMVVEVEARVEAVELLELEEMVATGLSLLLTHLLMLQ